MKHVLAVLLVLSTPAFAEESGSVQISGEIPQKTSIEVKGVKNDSLDLSGGEKDRKVAEVTEKNNTWKGYVVTMKSKYAGHMALESGIIGKLFNNIKYSAKYNGKSAPLSLFPQVVYSSPFFNLQAQERKHDLNISFDAQADKDLLAGTYSDTLTFTISAR